jgi:hypothetical protein
MGVVLRLPPLSCTPSKSGPMVEAGMGDAGTGVGDAGTGVGDAGAGVGDAGAGVGDAGGGVGDAGIICNAIPNDNRITPSTSACSGFSRSVEKRAPNCPPTAKNKNIMPARTKMFGNGVFVKVSTIRSTGLASYYTQFAARVQAYNQSAS